VTAFARPFNLHLPNGAVLHGAEYPSGDVFAIPPDSDEGAWGAVSLDVLLAERMPEGTRVVRPEEPTP
jgi:hypothetical protein